MSPRGIPHSELTERDAGVVVLDKNKRRLGCTVRLNNGKWAAWSLAEKLGEYPSPSEAENAVHKPRREP